MAGRENSLEETVYKRGEILCAIDDQPRAKPALTEAVGASRSTINRGVKELEEADCIERRNSKYHATLLGELSCERYRRYRSNVGALNKAKELISSLPVSANLNPVFFRGANIRSANPAAPESALQPAIDRLENADRMLGLTPVGISLYVDLIYEHANMNGLSVEIIVQNEALRPILELDEERLRELESEGQLEVYTVDEPLHYALWLMESSERVDAGATVYDNGGISGLLVNSSTEAVSWARSEYKRHRELAEKVSTDDLFDS